MGNRKVHRQSDASFQYPLRCALRVGGTEHELEVINFHFLGACLRAPSSELRHQLKSTPPGELSLRLGKKTLRDHVAFKVCWETLLDDGVFGIAFQKSVAPYVERSSRFPLHERHRLTLRTKDPLDPNRDLFFHVHDVSFGGMLISTSLSNKHLFPGMVLQKVSLPSEIGTQNTIGFKIENTRAAQEEGIFYLGVSFQNSTVNVLDVFKPHLVAMSPSGPNIETTLVETRSLGKQLKGSLSFRTIQTNSEYDELLHLRFRAYGKHGKIRHGAKWQDMGEGVQKEGILLGAFLGSKMVASVELRFGDQPIGLRYLDQAPQSLWEKLTRDTTVEINKLVVHPDLQGSDVVLGMVQKCHAIVLAKGGFWDAVFCATPKLLKLYQRAGAELLDHKIKHPNIENEELHFLVIRHKTYLGQDHFNPYAWRVVYSVVHEVMGSWGIAETPKNSVFRWLRLATTPVLKFLTSLRPERRVVEHTEHAHEQTTFIDPRWTKQDMLASVLLPYILEIEQLHGKAFMEKILQELKIPRIYFQSKSAWVSVELLNALLDAYQSKNGDVKVLNERAGWRAMARDVLGINYHIIRHLLTPIHAFKTSFEKIMPRINRSRTYRLISVEAQSVRIGIGARSGGDLPKHRETCANWRASFEAYIELLTGKRGIIHKQACCFDGDPECVYKISWDQRHKLGWELLLMTGRLGLSTTAGVAGLIATASFASAVLSAIVVFLALGFYRSARQLKNQNLELDALHKSSFDFQAEANERYAELQIAKVKLDQRYREATLLEETSKRLQRSTRLDEIFKVSLEDARSILNLSRAFVMLRDAKGDTLQTASVSGIDEGLDQLWKFRVDVARTRDNPTFVSSVYRTGNSVIINDIERHLFQLNAESQALIMRLKTQGFVMVQIPGAQRPWGVILADRSGRSEVLNQNDVTLLNRVAQFAGLALDKQGQLEHEQKLKERFQRFVPWGAINDTDQELQLGGQTKEVCCLFLDIRSFTTISQTLSPQGVIQMLNVFFGELQKVISKHGGTIDKFLGDGCMISWGATGQVHRMPQQAVGCALAVIDEMPRINAHLKALGLPEFKIGMGLSIGDVVAGNLGSQSRMEFTILGSAVNLASRLENLTKALGSELVISGQLVDLLPESFRQRFDTVGDVQIRGFEGAQRVGVLKNINKLRIAA